LNEKPKSTLGGNLVLPAILIVVTVAYLIEALRTLRPFQEGTAGPSFFPIVISVIMLAALVSVVWSGLKSQNKKAETVAVAQPIKVVVVTIVYIAIFQPAGYFLSTTAYVLALLYVFGFKARNVFITVLWSVLIAGSCFLLFSEIFRIRLPKLGGII